jgi:hypothetical protein
MFVAPADGNRVVLLPAIATGMLLSAREDEPVRPGHGVVTNPAAALRSEVGGVDKPRNSADPTDPAT